VSHYTSKLGALIGSRICHDLISPVGAISNGLELLNLSGTPIGPEMTLVSDSAAHANARIRFFRVAFGIASTERSMAYAETTSILWDVYSEKCTVDWRITDNLPRSEIQLAFLALMCAEQAVPFGGKLAVTGHAGALCVTATAARVLPRPEHWAILEAPNDAEDVPAAQVQFALLPMLLADQERKPEFKLSDQSVTLTI